ncbi:MAG: hypothetical protein AAF337_05175, partial [Pseudomonadota bacterium]
MVITRRFMLAGLGAATLLSGPRAAHSAPESPKLAIVLLRGAMDGLTALPKLDDPHIEAHRKRLIDPG